MLCISGCPTDDAQSETPAVDPTLPTTPALSINSTASILQFNAVGLTSPQFRESADLAAVVSNAGEVMSIAWRIQATGGTRLAFVDAQGARSASAIGEEVSVQVTGSPPSDVTHTVTATATLGDGTTLTAQILIVVSPDPVVGGDSTQLLANPFATPPIGVDAGGQVVLDAGDSGAVGSAVYQWAPLAPAQLPAAIALPADLTTQTLLLTVSGNVSGVFSFRVVVTDSIGNVSTGIVNVFLGIDNLIVDVRATRTQATPPTAVSLRTIRTGGVPDLDGAIDDTYAYQWQVLDSSGADVTAGAAIAPPSGTVADAEVIDWTVSGLVTADVYRFIVTVSDTAGMTNTSSASVMLAGGLSLAVETSRQRVGTGVGFSLRTVRSGGEPGFNYAFSVLDAAGADVTGATIITPPSGTAAAAATNDWAFTGFAAAGTYRIFATVTDGAGNSFSNSTEVLVGDVLTLSAEASLDQVGAGAEFRVLTRRVGGTANFTYTLSAIDSAGGDVTGATMFMPPSGTVSNAADNVWTVSGFAAPDTYRIFATVSDGLGNRFTSVTAIEVGDGLGLDASASTNIVAPGMVSTLTFNQTGGVGPYMYTFSNAGSGGNGAPLFSLASPAVAAGDLVLTWTAPAAAPGVAGSYLVDVTVTDALLNSSSESVWLIVQAEEVLSLDVEAAVFEIAPGNTLDIRSVRTGGSTSYLYAWEVLDSSNSPVAGLDPITVAPLSDATIDWTVSIPGAQPADTYRFRATVTDGLGSTFTSSTVVRIADPSPGQIAINAFADTNVLEPGGMAALTFDQTGGLAPYDYVYTATGPGGAGSFMPANPQNALPGDATTDWTAPAAAPGVAGSYRIDVTVTDALNDTATDSVWILVQADTPLALNASSDLYVLAPDESATLTFDQTGGVGDYNYDYLASGPGGAGSFMPTSPQNGEVGDTTSDWTAPAAAPGVTGSYRIDVTATDALGETSTDTVWILVQADTPLALNVSAALYVLAPDQSATLTFDQTGGVGPYDYEYSASGPGGVGSFMPTSPQNGELGDITSDWTAPSAAPGVTGSYRIDVTATDALGGTSTDSVWILVQADTPLSLDVRSDLYILTAGANAELTFDVTGGVANYDYDYEALDSSGTPVAGVFAPPSPRLNRAGDITVTFNSTGLQPDFYTIIVTVTDSVGSTFTDSIFIEVQ